MIRLFKFNDLDRIMELWLIGNLQAHPFIPAKWWEDNFHKVKAVLPNAEVYVYEENNIIQGFVGLDAEYIEGLFVEKRCQSQGIGQKLLDFVKQKKDRLSLHVYEKNDRAVAFYKKEDFKLEQCLVEKQHGEKEYLMVYHKKLV